MEQRKVIVADDEEAIRTLYQEFLGIIPDLKIDTAVDGVDLVDKVAANLGYRVVITDFQMPKLNGMEAARRIRELGYSGTLLLVTSLPLEYFLKEELDRNRIEHIQKSTKVWSEVTGRVQTYLNNIS